MNEQISQILGRMAALEDELRSAVQSQERKMFFEIRGRRVEFETSVKAAHRKLKKNFFRWLVTNRPQNLLTGPIIYSMVLPMLFFDACVSFFQWACFPVYGITKVRRSDYIVFDRHQLHYLNWIEKVHCTYCEYGNGLMGYARGAGPHRRVFLPDQARPQDSGHPRPLPPVFGLWRRRSL